MSNSVDVNNMKYNELFAYAKGTLGLDVPHGIKKDALLDIISKQTGTKVVQGAGDGVTEADQRVSKELKDLRKQPKVRIRIHENKDHPKRIQVSVNGVLYTMKPGAWVDVPESVVEVLRNAVMTTYTQEEVDGQLVSIPHNSLQYPFEVAPTGASLPAH